MANDQHIQWLQRSVALYRRLPAELRDDLLEMIPEFIDHVKWEGQADQEITEKMQVCIAAEACLPVLRLKRGLKVYRKLQLVQVFPRDLNPAGSSFAAGDTNGQRVRLGWHWARNGMANGEDGYNLVLHEFAHVIDFASLDGKADGVPPFDSYSDTRDWERFVAMEFEDFQRSAGVDYHSMDDYGACNEAEFFACATESFFERPKRLQLEWPAIYNKLKEYYGMDTVRWPADPSPPPPKVESEEENPAPDESLSPGELEPENPESESEKTSSATETPEPPPTDGPQLLKVEVNDDGMGSITEFHPNGERACRWDLKKHVHHGLWRRWNTEGVLVEEGRYRDGKRDDVYKLYHANGKKRVEGIYKNDKREGAWKRYYDGGELKQEDHYEKGELLRWEHWNRKGKSWRYGAWDERKKEPEEPLAR